MEPLLLYWPVDRHPKSAQYALAVVGTREENTRSESELTANGFFFFFFIIIFWDFAKVGRDYGGESADTYDIVSILDVLNAAWETDNGKVR